MSKRKFLVSVAALVAVITSENSLANTDKNHPVNLKVSEQNATKSDINKSVDQFDFILRSSASNTIYGAHRSHSSHRSHNSHRSHYSGY